MKMAPRRLSLLFGLPLTLPVTAGEPTPMLEAQVVAERGDPAPGFEDDNLQFEDFGVSTAFFGIEPSPRPRIGPGGNVSFVGIVGEDGVPNPGPCCADLGIPAVFEFDPTGLRLVARPGDPAPGTPSVFAGFPGPIGFPFSETTFSTTEGTAFRATTEEFPSMVGIGLWADRFGELQRVIRNGDVLPGALGTTLHSFTTGVEGEAIVVNGSVQSGATDGLWRDTTGSLEVIAIDGVPAPGAFPGVTFGEGTSLAFFGAVDGWDLNESGGVVFNGYLDGPPAVCGDGVCEIAEGENCLDCPEDCAGQQSGNPAEQFCCGNDPGENPVGCGDPRCSGDGFVCEEIPLIDVDNDEGIWADGPGGLELIVREGDPAQQAGPSIIFGSGANGDPSGLETFGPNTSITPRISDMGAILFGARITSPDFFVKTSLWTTRTGSPELLVTAATGLDGPDFPGDPAPGLGNNSTFSEFFEGDLSNDGKVAFLATTNVNGEPLSGTTGIWSDLPGELSLIAAIGQPVPAVPGAVFESPFGYFTHEHSDWDWLVIASAITGSGNSRALFLARDDGSVELVLRVGDNIRLSSGETKTLSSYGFGSGHTPGGHFVFEMTFTDGDHGVYVVDLVPPTRRDGDVTGDNNVGVTDLLAVLGSWGPCPAPCPPACISDVNSDCQVDVVDLLTVLANWS